MGEGSCHRRGDGRPGVADAEQVVVAFVGGGKAAHTAFLSQPLEQLAPTGEQLVRVALMADVPQQPILREIEDAMQGHAQLHGAQASGEVPAIASPQAIIITKSGVIVKKYFVLSVSLSKAKSKTLKPIR